MVPSPCTKICEIDAGTGWCRGCGRTLAEIGDWFYAGEGEKRAIVAALPARMRRLNNP
jgi:predicted Fe-S protein YdhL (DUF1289 family)